jgi:competence protein ComEC
MGLVLGLALIIGTRAAGTFAILLALVFAISVLAWLAPVSTHRFFGCVVVGLLVGGIAGVVRAPPHPTPLVSRPVEPLTALLLTDPKIESGGAGARARWTDSTGVSRESYVTLPAAPTVHRGETVLLHGTIEGPYGDVIRATHVTVVGEASHIERQRHQVREYLTSAISRGVPGSPGTLTLGLLIGDDSALPREEQTALRRSGLSHITAVSGWNVTMVTGAVGSLFLALRLRGWGWTAVQLAALVGYVWIVGLDPPVLRAAVMAVIALIALRLGRPAHSATALLLAAALMTTVSPGILNSLSFQLSTLATAAMVGAAHIAVRWSGWRKALAVPALTSALTGLVTAPVLAATFGTLSLATIPANVLAGPLIPLATFAGIALVAVSVVEPLATLVGATTWIACSLVLAIARVCADLPFVFWSFTPLPPAESGVLVVVVTIAACSLLPEGRYVARELSAWSRREPGPALAAGSALACVLIAALVLV